MVRRLGTLGQVCPVISLDTPSRMLGVVASVKWISSVGMNNDMAMEIEDELGFAIYHAAHQNQVPGDHPTATAARVGAVSRAGDGLKTRYGSYARCYRNGTGSRSGDRHHRTRNRTGGEGRHSEARFWDPTGPGDTAIRDPCTLSWTSGPRVADRGSETSLP